MSRGSCLVTLGLAIFTEKRRIAYNMVYGTFHGCCAWLEPVRDDVNKYTHMEVLEDIYSRRK